MAGTGTPSRMQPPAGQVVVVTGQGAARADTWGGRWASHWPPSTVGVGRTGRGDGKIAAVGVPPAVRPALFVERVLNTAIWWTLGDTIRTAG
jgi:hypothetical protein